MVSYFYAWVPLVLVGAVVLLSLPWLALVALMVVALVALAALVAVVWAIVAAPFAAGRAVARRWRRHARLDRPRAALPLGDSESSYLTTSERRSGEGR